MSTPLTLEQFDEILDDLCLYQQALPEYPEDGKPVVLSDNEVRIFQERGLLTREYRNGKLCVYVSKEKMEEFKGI